MRYYIIHRAFFVITMFAVLSGAWAAQNLLSPIDTNKWREAAMPMPEPGSKVIWPAE